MPEPSPEELARKALSIADESAEEFAGPILDRLRLESRQHVLALVLAAGEYRVGTELARRVGFPEEDVLELVDVVACDLGDDPYLAWSSAFEMESRLL